MIAVLTGVTGLGVALIIMIFVRNDRLHVANGLVWLAVAAAFAGLGFAPSIVDQLAKYLGVSYPPTLAFTIGFAFIVLKLLAEDIQNSRLRVRQQRIIQRLALLESEIRRLKRLSSLPEKDTKTDDQAHRES